MPASETFNLINELRPVFQVTTSLEWAFERLLECSVKEIDEVIARTDQAG
ncbi:MAG: hypothetical protein P8J29_06035 [Rhodospirillales bacterium]|nr:hypothetical protein [Rhodospirillales bacterium]